MDDNHKKPAVERKIKFRPNILSSTGKGNVKWIIIITFFSFALSAVLSFASSEILEGVNQYISVFIVLIIILIGILADLIGIAVTAANETPFHAMASRKLYGAKQSIKLIRNANKVSSICNDVIGDICGIISGTASAYIVLQVSVKLGPAAATVTGLVVSGFVAALTIGGKAIGKTVAIQNSNSIVYKVAVVVNFLAIRTGYEKGENSGKQKKKGNQM